VKLAFRSEVEHGKDSRAHDVSRRKVARRILPFLFISYFIAYLDRANVAFAYAPITRDLGFSDAVYGLGTGLFFLGYFFLEIPSAVIVERFGARRWIGRIMITWGLVTVLFAFQRTSIHFYSLRLLLGLAEAGFFPGVIVYLTHWFPHADRMRALSGFAVAAPVSLAIGGPTSSAILQINWFGISNWRWLFIVQGMLAVVAGIAALFYLTDHPRDAGWLTPGERTQIQNTIDHENAASSSGKWWHALRDSNVLLLCVAQLFLTIGGYGFIFWLPGIMQGRLSISPARADTLSVLPFLLAAGAMWLIGCSNSTRRVKLLAILPMLCAAAFFSMSATAQPRELVFTWLCLTGASVYAWLPAFWLLATLLSVGSSRAAGVGLINSIGNLGGFLGPMMIGYLRTITTSSAPVVLVVSLSYCAAAVCTALVKRPSGA
jgi:ACS family tartrate transporter-like MFS transporter